MIVTEILGNVHDDAGAALVGDRHREQVHLEGSALVKRIQLVATSRDVMWVNDSKATNPHAADASLAAFSSVVWLASGCQPPSLWSRQSDPPGATCHADCVCSQIDGSGSRE